MAEQRALAKEERLLLQQEAEEGRTEETLLKLQGIENKKNDILIKSEIEKANLIKDADKRKEALRQAYIKREELQQRTATKNAISLARFQAQETVKQDKAEKDALERNRKNDLALRQGYLTATGRLLCSASSLAKKGSREQKAISLADATINTYAAGARAMKDYPYPANLAVLASTIAAGLIQVKKISDAGSYQEGGIIPGSSFSGDRLTANVNSGEMILNKSQQTELFNVANGSGNNTQLIEAINNLASRPVVVEIDNREVARAVQSARQEGLAI